MFNENVSHLVKLVTKEKGTNAKKPEKLIEYLNNIKGNQDASIIKTADKGAGERRC